MKINLLLILICFNFLNIFAKQITPETSKKVAFNFLKSLKSIDNINNLNLIYIEKSKKSNNLSSQSELNYFYIYNYLNEGFVIVSGDDIVTPILGYSSENSFNYNQEHQSIIKWLEGYKDEIRYAIVNDLKADNFISTSWNNLIEGKSSIYNSNQESFITKRAAVSPLMTTKWNQSPYYNALCPLDNSSGQRTVSGCVATAMTQVMKYWNHPAQGTGNHSYQHSKYGTLSANFGSTTYNWSSMPNSVTSSNTAVATLTYQVGVSVNMNYGIASTGGSGAYVINDKSPVTNCTEYALKTYFGYKTSLKGVERANYTSSNWINLLKTELNASRPVIYAGFGSGGGHCFVADGYDNNDYFHFNWGWGGSSDGYFSINALNPGSLGTGGGSGGFNSGHQAVIGVEPDGGNGGGGGSGTMDMRLYSNITMSANPVTYNTSFSVTANLANYGTSSTQNFNGDLTAAIFNSNNEFVSFIETKTGVSLEFQKYFTQTFSTSALSSLTPGNYMVGIYYKKTGATQWTAFANGAYQNFVTFEVKGQDNNPMKLYAAIVTTPTTLVQNQSFQIYFDIANFGSTDFDGDVSVDLHKSDGTWIRELDKIEGLSLQAGYHFTNGITFTITGGLTDEPGNYQLFVWSKPSGGSWNYLGSGNYSNPVNIVLAAPGLSPDAYEANNTESTAYNVNLNFSNNLSKFKSIGSNCHNGTDYDYYKFILPSGYNYTINAKINDAYKSTDGNTYTLDAVFSISTDGGNSFSDAYDSELPSQVNVNGGQTVIIKVSPYFTGEFGTYLLDVSINRGASTSTNLVDIKNLNIYPLPFTQILNIDFSSQSFENANIKITDLSGKVIFEDNITYQNLYKINSSEFVEGVYILTIETEKGIYKQQIIKQ